LSLKKRTVIGVLWNFLEQLARRGVSLSVTLLLAYFVTPEDYGLVAMVAVFLTIATQVADSGFREALIRLEAPEPEDFDTAFLANTALGLFGYLVLFLVAPAVAAFYDEPQLVLVLRVVGLVVPIQAAQIVQVATLSRALDFRAQMAASLPAALVSGVVAVALAAALGAGVWALVVQRLLAAVILTSLLWRAGRYRPGFRFRMSSLKAMYDFGYKLLIARAVTAVFQNIYVLIIGRLYDATTAGQYFFAFRVQDLVLAQLVRAIQRVTYPALAQVQDDPARLRRGYRQVLMATTFATSPFMAALLWFSPDAFSVGLAPRWGPSAGMLQVISVAGLLYPLHVINLNVLKVHGRTDLLLFINLVKRSFAVVVILVTAPMGLEALLVGQVVSSVFSFLPNAYYTRRLINYGWWGQLRDVLPQLVLAVGCGGVARWTVALAEPTSLLSLMVGLPLAGTLYVLLGAVMGVEAWSVVVGVAQSVAARRVAPKQRGGGRNE